jgi:hypothetical protein
MKKIDLKQRMREVMFTTEHTLNEDQRNKLIQAKFERAKKFSRLKQVQQERTLHP